MTEGTYQQVSIRSIASNLSVSFGPVIFTKYSDNVSVNFNSEPVFGRTDPIYTYASNDRKLEVGFIFTLEGTNGMNELNKLAHTIYPSYSGRNIVNSSPLISAKFGNFTSYELLGFLNSVRYEYANPNNLSNLPIQREGLVVPRYIQLDLQMTVINRETLKNNGTGRIFQ
jgi:hypothetical protein